MSVLDAPAPTQPTTVRDHEKFHRLVARAQQNPPVRVAVAHPCDKSSLEAVVSAANLKLIEPILVGPEQRIREVAAANDIDISRFEIVDTRNRAETAARTLP